MVSNSRLVYSTNSTLNQKCPKCKESTAECICPSEIETKTQSLIAVLRLEKSGRGGKTVTVIDQLPKSERFLKELCTELKKKCGSGGTYRLSEFSGIIEIQGDKRDTLRVILSKKEMLVKG